MRLDCPRAGNENTAMIRIIVATLKLRSFTVALPFDVARIEKHQHTIINCLREGRPPHHVRGRGVRWSGAFPSSKVRNAPRADIPGQSPKWSDGP